MLFRLQIGPGGLKEKKKRSSNYQKMLSIQFSGGGRRNSRLRLLVGVSAALLGASNSFLFLLYTGFASIFSSFSIFFVVFPPARSGDSFPNACEKFVDNIFVPISL